MLYTSKEVPKFYVCTTCKKTGVKLWREYNTFLDHQTLSCADCALEEAKRPDGLGVIYEGPATSDGRVKIHYTRKDKEPFGHHLGDSIGWRVPAVPTEEEDTYWGYTSVPKEGVQWWKDLPTYLP